MSLNKPIIYVALTAVAGIIAGFVLHSLYGNHQKEAPNNRPDPVVIQGSGNVVQTPTIMDSVDSNQNLQIGSGNQVTQDVRGSDNVAIGQSAGDITINQGKVPVQVTNFRLKNLANAVSKGNAPFPLGLTYDIANSPIPIEDLSIRFGWSPDTLADSPYCPGNLPVITADTPTGPTTIYLYLKTPEGYVTTESFTFFVLD